MVELKETPGKAGETPEKRGEPQSGISAVKALLYDDENSMEFSDFK